MKVYFFIPIIFLSWLTIGTISTPVEDVEYSGKNTMNCKVGDRNKKSRNKFKQARLVLESNKTYSLKIGYYFMDYGSAPTHGYDYCVELNEPDIGFVIRNVDPKNLKKVYKIDAEGEENSFGYYNRNLEQRYSTASSGAGEVNVLFFDPDKKIIGGTFAFDVSHPKLGKMSVTEGTFDLIFCEK